MCVSQSKSLRTKKIKFTECQLLRENWYEMFICSLTPKELAKTNRRAWEALETLPYRCSIILDVVDTQGSQETPMW